MPQTLSHQFPPTEIQLKIKGAIYTRANGMYASLEVRSSCHLVCFPSARCSPMILLWQEHWSVQNALFLIAWGGPKTLSVVVTETLQWLCLSTILFTQQS